MDPERNQGNNTYHHGLTWGIDINSWHRRRLSEWNTISLGTKIKNKQTTTKKLDVPQQKNG